MKNKEFKMQNVNENITIARDELLNNVVIYKFQEDDFIFVYMNKNAEKTENISKDELIGKKLTEAFPEAKDFGFFDILLKVYEDGKPRELGTSFYRDEKMQCWRYNSARKLSSGELIVFYKDMTKCKQLEDELYHLDAKTAEERKKNQLLAKALELTDDMVFITDANGIIEYVNDSVLVKTGYERSELIGNKTNIFKSGKQTDAFYQELWKTILSGKNYNSIIIDKAKDERLYYADLKITPLFDEKNETIQNFVATSTDVTSRIKMEEKLKKLATIDSLTQIYNRYEIDNAIKMKIARYRRYKETFCLLMFDIDHFKSVNDTYGHDAGDRVLKALSHLVSNHIRTTDIFGRWGGEEFMILLENTKKEESFVIAEKLRQSVEAAVIDTKYKITISIGVAQYEEPESKEELVKKVDKALYRAKENERNQVVVA